MPPREENLDGVHLDGDKENRRTNIRPRALFLTSWGHARFTMRRSGVDPLRGPCKMEHNGKARVGGARYAETEMGLSGQRMINEKQTLFMGLADSLVGWPVSRILTHRMANAGAERQATPRAESKTMNANRIAEGTGAVETIPHPVVDGLRVS